jgi:hypothetical protein
MFAHKFYLSQENVSEMIRKKLEKEELERKNFLKKLEKEADDIVNNVPEIIEKNLNKKNIKISNVTNREKFATILMRKLENNGYYSVLLDFPDNETYVFIVNSVNTLLSCNIL